MNLTKKLKKEINLSLAEKYIREKNSSIVIQSYLINKINFSQKYDQILIQTTSVKRSDLIHSKISKFLVGPTMVRVFEDKENFVSYLSETSKYLSSICYIKHNKVSSDLSLTNFEKWTFNSNEICSLLFSVLQENLILPNDFIEVKL